MLSDVEALDIAFYNSLKYVQDNDPEPLDLNFAVLEETFGEVRGRAHITHHTCYTLLFEFTI